MRTRHSGVAIVLSFFISGLGQLYNGQIAKGLGLMAVYGILWVVSEALRRSGLAAVQGAAGPEVLGQTFTVVVIAYALLIAATLSVWIYGMVDAKRTADRLSPRASVPSR